MDPVQFNDRVVCIDATPIPLNVPDTDFGDFTFPHGFLKEGQTYCVTAVIRGSDGQPGYRLAGLPILHDGGEIHLNGQRFRRIHHRSIGETEAANEEGQSSCVSTN